ncbi:hypothetical protein MUK42_34639 [Musa troglodytarum]|uniref:Uncharacterized protein n=1 Tax=Musa troglodytarum TaxID=320322 RepID=A0A9E7E7K7_9LILI|nr:hypothetical protein MUK42_34639 [Musa troglodytarum]
MSLLKTQKNKRKKKKNQEKRRAREARRRASPNISSAAAADIAGRTSSSWPQATTHRLSLPLSPPLAGTFKSSSIFSSAFIRGRTS